jgi:3-methyl-2-oxobutanoate hydroxymethyltransferase
MVKLEGGSVMAPAVRMLVERGIPVCAHLGLTPQSVHALGGYRVQGKTDAQAAQLLADAGALEDAGAALLVLELMPSAVASQVTAALTRAATIGIGAGSVCHGQVLVLHDMLDVYPGRKPRFVRNFMAEGGSIADAVRRYVKAVKDRSFPAAQHAY